MSASSKNIIIEGPIGVGKSSLARKLGQSFGSTLIMEQPKLNPFLERFYNQPDRYALATQLSFLFTRAEQLKEADQQNNSASGYVSDFMFDKELLFAKLNLTEDEYTLYEQAHANLNFQPRRPDLLIYLQAPVDVLVARINKRSVKYELGMDADYLSKLNNAYTQFFHAYDASPLLIVNATKINPVDNAEHYQALLNHLSQIHAGKHFFNPLADAVDA